MNDIEKDNVNCFEMGNNSIKPDKPRGFPFSN